MSSAHELGNVLVNHLVEKRTTIEDFFYLMETFQYDFGDNCPSLNQVIPITLIDGSPIKRKWLQKDESLKLKFHLNKDYHFSLQREKKLLDIKIEGN